MALRGIHILYKRTAEWWPLLSGVQHTHDFHPLRHDSIEHDVVDNQNPQAFYAGLRVVAMDGSNFELPDESENVTHFGYPGSRTGHAVPGNCILKSPINADSSIPMGIYHERWDVESVFDELKTHLLQSRRVFRSKTPELVKQEFYGWVLAYYCVRWLLHQGVGKSGAAHAQQSFTGHVQLLRRAQPRSGAFSP
jgi:hypothetical protein